ncbi:hypothetical protein HHL16_02830 [Pseudoflavitalea sp. G-6-1-2]|uniref:hypothetical protein n=1 Tax=Pseudoflavitalea sp. G-6-1-2 TaxID=2728841 RepID=UPI00146EEE6E|nr:hypothetical protein [Pseudoflavitalea sp. G-6-1-2]NML19787.1 hypothetical protein [Pseudoflavitalea sp. G-6-1-2]
MVVQALQIPAVFSILLNKPQPMSLPILIYGRKSNRFGKWLAILPLLIILYWIKASGPRERDSVNIRLIIFIVAFVVLLIVVLVQRWKPQPEITLEDIGITIGENGMVSWERISSFCIVYFTNTWKTVLELNYNDNTTEAFDITNARVKPEELVNQMMIYKGDVDIKYLGHYEKRSGEASISGSSEVR